MFWLNKERKFITNAEIVEWDIRSGNTSIMKEYKLAPYNTIARLEKMSKSERVIAVGKIMQVNKEFSKKLEDGFNDAVNRFIEANDLSRDIDIISIKRDAVYTINKNISTTKIGSHIDFIPKNMYHAYVYLEGKEFYFKKNWDNESIDVKGMNDKLLPRHHNGIHQMLIQVINLLKKPDDCEAHQYMHEFVDAYKKRELDLDFYRAYNEESKFYVNVGDDETVLFDVITEDMLPQVDIRYNYTNIILPLIELMVA